METFTYGVREGKRWRLYQNLTYSHRNPIILDWEDPDDAELIERVKAMTDYDETVHGGIIDLPVFVDAYHRIASVVKKRHVNDGVVGPRKLADWVQVTMVTHSPRQSARKTIIPGATFDKAVKDELCGIVDDLFIN